MRKLFLAVLVTLALPAAAVTVDRIAAVIDQQVLTVSEVGQMADVRFFPRTAGQSEDEYRRAILESLIAQALRLRDVERFGAPDISPETIEARLQEIESRFASASEFEEALARAELTMEELQTLVKRQLQVETYIQERFAPLVFVSAEEIEEYYRTRWRGRAASLDTVRDQIRTLLRDERLAQDIERWTNRLRLQANVDIYAWR